LKHRHMDCHLIEPPHGVCSAEGIIRTWTKP